MAPSCHYDGLNLYFVVEYTLKDLTPWSILYVQTITLYENRNSNYYWKLNTIWFSRWGFCNIIGDMLWLTCVKVWLEAHTSPVASKLIACVYSLLYMLCSLSLLPLQCVELYYMANQNLISDCWNVHLMPVADIVAPLIPHAPFSKRTIPSSWWSSIKQK